MRKVGIAVACAATVAVLTLGLAGCGSSAGSGSSQGSSNAAIVEKQAVTSTSTSSASSTATSVASQEDYTQKISIEGDYSYESGSTTYRVLVVKNNSDATLKIASNSTALDAGGNLVGADDADTSAVGPGCVSYLKEHFSNVTGIDKFDTKLSANVDKRSSVLQDLELSANPAGSNVVLQCTNNGSQPALFVQALVLYFNGNTLVDTSERYLTDDNSELAPGNTQSEQVSTRETFDSISVYLSGRGK